MHPSGFFRHLPRCAFGAGLAGAASPVYAATWGTPEWLPTWPGYVIAGTLVALATSLLLRGRHRRRERDFAISASRLQFLFDSAPVAILVTDMRAQVAWLDDLRQEGVTNLKAYLQANPEKLRDSFSRLEVVAVNRTALELGGFRDLEAIRAGMARFTQDFSAPFLAELAPCGPATRAGTRRDVSS